MNWVKNAMRKFQICVEISIGFRLQASQASKIKLTQFEAVAIPIAFAR
jgi:hypothetical protein